MHWPVSGSVMWPSVKPTRRASFSIRCRKNSAAKASVAKLAKQIELADQAASLGNTDDLRAAVDADPANHQARLDYAVALNAHGQRNEAVDQLIAIVKADREWNEDGGRKQLARFLRDLGPDGQGHDLRASLPVVRSFLLRARR